jgi:nucleoside-triphosphatase THEP1
MSVGADEMFQFRPATSSRRPGMPDRQIAILTGASGTGKTTTCGRLLDHARDLGLDCAGILSPARVDGGAKVGIDVVDVRTEERRRLAEVDELPARLRLGPYRFDDEAVAWGAARLGVACPCDILFVDEIGPLEMDRGEGWVNALDILRVGHYSLAVAVVRGSLVDPVRAAVGTSETGLVQRCVVPGREGLRELLSLVELAASAREP